MIHHLASTSTLVASSQLKLSFRHGFIKQSTIIMCCRHFHPRKDMDKSRDIDNQSSHKQISGASPRRKASLSRLWKELHFPPGLRCFASDNMDPNEWTMVYRYEWTRIGVASVGYASFLVVILSIKMLYDVIVKNRLPSFLDHDSEDPDADGIDELLLIGATIFALLVSLLIAQAYPKLITRGYYSPKYQKFVFIRPSVLTPWRTRKLVCGPGSGAELTKNLKSIVRSFLGTYEIGGSKKVILYPNNFFLPAYYNVLCGYAGPRTLIQLRPDPDVSLRMLVTRETND